MGEAGNSPQCGIGTKPLTIRALPLHSFCAFTANSYTLILKTPPFPFLKPRFCYRFSQKEERYPGCMAHTMKEVRMYKKPQVKKHDKLSQVTFSSH